MLNGHGNDKYNAARELIADFSSNVWYKPLPKVFYNKLARVLKQTIDYPHPFASELRKDIANFHKLNEKNVWVTNGSVEGIYMLAQAFCRKKTAIIYPSFSEYEDACKRYKHIISYYQNWGTWNRQTFSEDLVWFGNPNNPDGKTVKPGDIKKNVVAHPETTFVVDEAFSGLCIGFESVVTEIEHCKNLVVLKSFTKLFSIPGIRLGYVVGSEEIIEQLKKLSIPWSVNSIAAEAGKIILSDYKTFLPNYNELEELNNYLITQLGTIKNLGVISSRCNFVLVKINGGNSKSLKKYLLNKHGILVRDASNFRGLDKHYIRLSVQAKDKVDLLIKALKIYFNELA